MPAIGRVALNLVLATIDVYAVGTLALVLAHALTGERFWPLALAQNFLPWMLLIALPLLAIVLLARRWRRAVLVGAVALSFVWLFGGLFMPTIRPASVCAGDTPGCHLTVMSYNLLGDDHPDVAAQMEIIRRADADIVALQEVSPRAAQAIDETLADLYPYRALYPHGIPGSGLLSKYPIGQVEAFQLTEGALYHTWAEVEIEGRTVTVISAHPPPPAYNRRDGYWARGGAEIQALTQMATSGGPALLLGDFNISDLTAEYEVMRSAGLVDAFRQAGWGLGVTFPARFGTVDRFPPLVRIDYIWHTQDFTTTRAWVDRTSVGADHRPVIAQLVWRAGE